MINIILHIVPTFNLTSNITTVINAKVWVDGYFLFSITAEKKRTYTKLGIEISYRLTT